MPIATPDISDDFDYIDNLQTVTVKSMESDESFTDVTGVSAFVEHLPSGYQLDAHIITAVWHLKAGDMGATIVKEDDRIVSSADGTYVIVAADLDSWQTRYACATYKLIS
jgi:hypothetical protein